jgi:hypothetical protein
MLDERHHELPVAVRDMPQQLQHFRRRVFGIRLVQKRKANGRHQHRAGLQPSAARDRHRPHGEVQFVDRRIFDHPL